jgi:PAS domain S-box-containing protein
MLFMTPPRSSPFAFRLLAGAITVALIAGATVIAARRAERLLRADLLMQTRLVALSLCPEHVAKLTGTAADYTSPDYLHVHELLTRIRNASPHCRFLYLMERRPDGVVIFTDDSDPFDSKDHSPPGQTYDEAPAELHAAFAANQAIVRGPYGDRWGTWVSSFVPLSDPKSTMLGMDIDAHDWKRQVALRAALPAVLAAIAILVGLLAVLLQKSRRKLRAQHTAVQEGEAQKQAILNGITTSIALVDPNLKIIWANQAAAASVHKRMEDLIGHPCYSFWGDPARPCEGCPTVTAFHSGKTAHKIVQTPDGRIWDETGEPVFDADGNVVSVVEIASEITACKQAEEKIHVLLKESEKSRRALLGILEEQKRAEEKLRALSQRNEALLAAIPEIVMQVDVNKVYTWANRIGVEFFGDDVIGKEAAFYFEGEQETYATVKPLFGGNEGVVRVASWQRRRDGEKRLLVWSCRVLKDAQGQVLGALSMAQDITEHRMADDYRAMRVDVLQILNEPGDLPDALQRIIPVLKAWTGFEAVGLRLQDGEDFPYYAQDGFSKEFLLTENALAERGPDGGVYRDKDGKACLECTCGLVISGKTDPSSPLFTSGGSFWTNDSASLLALPPDQDPRHHPRNTCIHHGYASVALIPVRDKERIVGLLHLNDRRKGRFTPATVKILEDVAAHIGESLSRRRGEEKLKRSDEQFRTLAEVAPVGIYLCDPEGHCLYANPAWCGMAGLSAEESLGKGWMAGLHPEDRDRIFASWEHMVESHGQWGLEYRFQTREGKVTWVYGLATPQYDGSNKIVQYVGVNIDITERKREDDVLAFLAQSSSGGTKEPFFSVLARYLAQLLGMDFVCIDRLEGDGLSARTVAVWHDGRFEDNVTYALKDTPCGDVVGKQVCCFPASVCLSFPRDQVLKDLRAESYIGVTLFGHTGKPVGLIAVIGRGPLANRPMAEAVLRLVAVRAAGEIERQDAELERQKMDKLQSIGTLAGGIAHDFNNILLGLFGNISLAMDDLPKEHPSYAPLEEANRSMSRAVRLTKQLLTFAKGGDPVKEAVSVGAMVEEVARFDLTGSNVSLVYHHDADLWPVDADRGQLQQVVSNLVINARQAMPNGGHLTITLENADLPAEAVPALRPGRYVKISVQDEGCGIAPTLLDRIFDPYFTTKQTGNGLGLATVWSIINKHNGHIGVASELGKGTVFTFYLPAAASVPPEEIKPLAVECPSPGRPAKILVMDDEELVCTLASKILTRCGYTVATAPDAQEATALYKEARRCGAPFDLVIMDLTIPGGPGGKEVIKDLLALEPRVHAIVSSGYADDPVMANPSAYGFKGTVAKPYTARALREAVARVLA